MKIKIIRGQKLRVTEMKKNSIIKVLLIFMIVVCVACCCLLLNCRKKETEKQPTHGSQEPVSRSSSSQEESHKESETFTPTGYKEKENRDFDIATKVSDEEGIFDEILKLWDQGETKSAVEKFLLIKWESPEIFSRTSILRLKEKEFVSFPESRRNDIKQKSREITKTIRALVKHILSMAKASLATKDYDLAESQFNSVLECGKALSCSESLIVIKMLGTTIQRIALKELIQLYTETNNQVKLEAAEKNLSQL